MKPLMRQVQRRRRKVAASRVEVKYAETDGRYIRFEAAALETGRIQLFSSPLFE